MIEAEESSAIARTYRMPAWWLELDAINSNLVAVRVKRNDLRLVRVQSTRPDGRDPPQLVRSGPA